MGRFLKRDPMGYGGGINLYGYTRNNPINRIDPLGLDSDENLWDRFKDGVRGWNNALGLTRDFLTGQGETDRVYSQNSIQVKELLNSTAGRAMLAGIARSSRKVNAFGVVKSQPAAFDSIIADGCENATEDQLGAFEWAIIGKHGNDLTIAVVNAVSNNSFLYHVRGVVDYERNTPFDTPYGQVSVTDLPLGTINQKLVFHVPVAMPHAKTK